MKPIKNIFASILVFSLLLIATFLVIGEPDESISFFAGVLIRLFGFAIGSIAVLLMGNWNLYDKNETV